MSSSSSPELHSFCCSTWLDASALLTVDVFSEGSGIVSSLCVCAHCRNDLCSKPKHVFIVTNSVLFCFGPLCLLKQKYHVFRSYAVQHTIIHFSCYVIKQWKTPSNLQVQLRLPFSVSQHLDQWNYYLSYENSVPGWLLFVAGMQSFAFYHAPFLWIYMFSYKVCFFTGTRPWLNHLYLSPVIHMCVYAFWCVWMRRSFWGLPDKQKMASL